MPQPQMTQEFSRPAGGCLVTVDGATLPLRGVQLRADCCAGLAAVTLVQEFVNPYDEPLRVTYQVPLPADGAVSGYRFRIGDREVVGRVDRKETARERFEQALVEGRTAALLDQDRSSLFTQEVGNVPPHTKIKVELTIDQKLAWHRGWEWRFPTVVAPRYMGAPGRVPDAARVSVDVADGPMPPRVGLELTIRDGVAGHIESPSHGVAVRRAVDSHAVTLPEGSAALDRDVVVRWPVAAREPGLALDVARPGDGHARSATAFGTLCIVPPLAPEEHASVRRDLVVLIDTSGSMHGAPLIQAQKITDALIATLGPDDRLEMIEFSTGPRRWKRGATPATELEKAAARAWVAGLIARGGTEMHSGISAALDGLRPEAQRQIVLISDGLIGFEEEIIAEIATRMPPGSRVHTVGVGSGVNRSLTSPAARAGRGVEVIIGVDEDAERVIPRLLAATDAPLVVDLELGGSAVLEHAPVRIPDLLAGSPARVGVALRPGGGQLTLSGRGESGSWSQTIDVAPAEPGEGSAAVVALFGREVVEDLEVRRAQGEPADEVDPRVEQVGLEFQIATRRTSWVAISDEATVDPRDPTRHEAIPQALPHGMSVAGLGLRRSAMQPMAVAAAPMQFGAAELEVDDGVAQPKILGFIPVGRARRPTTIEPQAAEPTFGIDDGPPELLEDKFRDDREQAPSQPPRPRLPRGPHAPRGRRSKRKDGLVGRALKAERTSAGGPGEPLADPLIQARGRIIATAAGLVVEVTIPADLIWARPESVTLILADGGRYTLSTDEARSTRDGKVLARAVVRVALVSIPLPSDPVVATFEAGPLTFEVQLGNA